MALKVGVNGKFLNAVNTHYDTYNRTNRKGDEFYLYGTGKLEGIFGSGENTDGTKYRHDRVGQYTYSGGRAWRSYIPDAYDYTTNNNPDDIGYHINGLFDYEANQNFLYAQGKIFVGAPGTTVSGTLKGAVAVIYPHRMKGNLSTDFQQEALAAISSDTYGKHWSVFSCSESEANMWFGQSLAFTQGQLFVGAPYKDDNYTDEGRIFRFTGDFTYGSPTETKYDAGTIGDAGGLDFSNFVSGQDWGRYMSAANGVLCVGSDQGIAYITHLARKESDWDDWIKIPGQTDPGGQSAKDGGFADMVAVGCGRVIINQPFYDDNTGSVITNAGAFHIYDYYGNHIRTVTRPGGSASNRYFGISIAVGCGRIAASALDGVSDQLHIFDLDGDHIKTAEADVFNPYFNYTDPIAIGFGRIACVDPTANTNQGEVGLLDLDGNLIGTNLLPNQNINNQYMGRGGLAIGPDRLFAFANAYSSATTHPSVNEWPIHTSMTRWDVEAMEDGDV